MENMELFCVRNCWGNLAFNYIHSNSVGNSGGILCVWDSNSFTKESHRLSDYFVIIRGKWLKNDSDLMLVTVYAPHDPRNKRMVWEYLTHVINQWNGNVVVLGDFNEVRFKSDRFGSIFNVQGADEFNSFIEDAGLEEVPLRGSHFTLCHKSATKMSKLDRFFILNSLFNSCPHLSAITLDRFLSDHRPILLCETNVDYGPIPFRFVHHWIKLDGFSTFDKPVDNRIPFETTFSKQISRDQQIKLERMVTKEELKVAVWDCGTNKSPGPDGFTFGFFWHFWSILEEDVYEAVIHFFVHGDIPPGCNPSFITLIPKVPAANMVNRFGSIFNVQGADEFNSFIEDTGLEEVPLGGSHFTWCHKSATKMSKLDRFFISNSLFNSCPHLSAITLDRFLSDHRPILLCENNVDYGPIPFRFFHHWIKLDGFSTFVSDVWNSAPGNKDNGMRNLAGKLKFLKGKIREWIKSSKVKGKSDSNYLKEELRVLDERIDKGGRSDDLLQRRMELIYDIQFLDQLHAMELAQKSKIKWAIKGDENTRFFHGVLNKKRNQMAIRGVLVD
nr:RNA-directed DNA polymerase, eukaryota [Tanacetum cinerariifolium]